MPRTKFTGRDDKRNGRGGARPNAGRKSSEVKALRESMQRDFPAAIDKIRTLMKSKDSRVAYDACKWWAEQVIGKAEQRVSHVDAVGQTLPLLVVAGVSASDV